MKKNNKKRPLNFNILVSFIVFSIGLLLFLWFFQILFLNTFYKISRTKAITESLISLTKSYDNNNYKSLYDEISLNNNICIEVVKNNRIIYSSRSVDKKCMTRNNMGLLKFQTDFVMNDKSLGKAEIINPNYNNETLVAGKKLENDTYLFVNTSLVPLDDSINILKSQFVYIAIIVFIMSIVISYFISKKLAIPITKLNKDAKRIGKKDYSVKFVSDTNILELDELGETLNDAVLELSKTDTLRRELMANVSHDLKTPLTLIRAYAEAAKDIDADKKEKRENDLDIIVQETERLTLLVNDILALSKLESNVYEIEKSDFNIKNMVDDIIHKFNILKEEGFQFIVNCDNDITVNSDLKKIQQVIYNLINNAINYTGADKKVIVNVIKLNDSTRVEVIDTGEGIPEEKINLIWDKYYKVDKQHKRNKYGTGLGLSIVKSLLISLGYMYGVESKVGHGTKFYFEIK